MKIHRSFFSITFLLITIASFAQKFDSILFTGRFDFTDSEKVVYSHVSASIKANFEGTEISAVFSSEKGTSYLMVIIDGIDSISQRKLISVSSSAPEEIILASDIQPGGHQIEIVKTNQYDTKVAFHGFIVENGTITSKPERPQLSIEYYGDSNPAGHSAWDPYDWGAIKDNGGYYTYPGITARMLDAEYINISMGGAGITNRAWRNLVDYHHLIHMDDPASGNNTWDFANNHLSFQADAVVINLGANDYYGSASKNDIKTGWKTFISNHLRTYYPESHIVLVNSYGWAYSEPADYVHEAVEEIKNSGDNNVSYLRFPWLWGQEHAVVNEHAGFANLLAVHLAEKLGLPEPELNELSSFAEPGKGYNGDFEISSINGYADGWRPHGDNVTLIVNSDEAYEGENFLRLQNTSWANFTTQVQEDEQITVSGWIKKSGAGNNLGKLKIEFKDQAQNTIATNEGLFGAQDDWRQTNTTAIAPKGTWSVWIVLAAEENSIIDFDKIQVNESASIVKQVISNKEQLVLYPNPLIGKSLYFCSSDNHFEHIQIFDNLGRIVYRKPIQPSVKNLIDLPESIIPGIYTVILFGNKSYKTEMLIIQ